MYIIFPLSFNRLFNQLDFYVEIERNFFNRGTVSAREQFRYDTSIDRIVCRMSKHLLDIDQGYVRFTAM